MYGLIVGDALGVPYEFKERDSFKMESMAGFGTHNQPPGTWSDDSSMALATIDSFLNTEIFDYDDLMTRFSGWMHNGDYSPYGKCFDIGHTTLNAIVRFDEGRKPISCGGKGFKDNGNGSLMRILPIAFVEHKIDDILNLSSLTHSHEISLMSCRLYVQLAENLMNGMSKEDAVKKLTCCVDECENIPVIKEFERKRISSSGYVVDTFEAAVWCLMNTESYKDCIVAAIELGNDTDTVAAVAGGLAGIYYGIGGEKGIPEEWIDSLAKKDWIEEMLEKAILQ
ncbi:MAG: ADP-ribosylglycohydrolase family protein [Clostridia bacterium]|nr:ADP-ribosylglycohydrolase family protein [Clostridia bacterium]